VTTARFGMVRPLWWTPRRSRWLLVAVHVPLVVASPIHTILGLEGRPRGEPWLIVLLAAAIGGLQLWHSFAAARDERPEGWPWTLLALAVLVYAPLLLFTWNWAAMQWFVVASAGMHLRGRARAIAVAAPILGTAVAAFHWSQPTGSDLTWVGATFFFYWLVPMAALPAILVGATRLVRALDELYATRVELAQSAVGTERSRLARDLHDLLGQSLTAVSLKGDLALALLPTDRHAAEEEIRGLTAIARDALRGMMNVTSGEHIVSLREEANRAARLLEAAGIDAHVDVTSSALSVPVDEALAWATREGITNLLRHSRARHCSITAARHDGVVRLEIVNDGASDSAGSSEGRGLVGVTERARELLGSTSAGLCGDGRFMLRVEVPEATA
jgi:two-component system, NarL family, sensor histidine kinase DesK